MDASPFNICEDNLKIKNHLTSYALVSLAFDYISDDDDLLINLYKVSPVNNKYKLIDLLHEQLIEEDFIDLCLSIAQIAILHSVMRTSV